MLAGIYKLENLINGKIYIGQSIDLVKRIRAYKNCQCIGQTKIYNAIKRYGWENFQVEYLYSRDIEEVTIDTLNHLEAFYIEAYQSIRKGYNLMTGGNNSRHTEESKLKLSISHKGLLVGEKNYMYGKHLSKETIDKMKETKKNMSLETRQNMSKAQLGKKATEETKKKISEIHKGRKRSIETKTNISNALKGKSKSDEHKLKLRLTKTKAVNQYDLDMNFINSFFSIKQAQLELKINESLISKCCKGKINKAGGFIFQYK